MCTYNGYYTTFDEKQRGSLEAGKIADMLILSANPYKVPKENLKIQSKKCPSGSENQSFHSKHLCRCLSIPPIEDSGIIYRIIRQFFMNSAVYSMQKLHH